MARFAQCYNIFFSASGEWVSVSKMMSDEVLFGLAIGATMIITIKNFSS